MDVSQCTCRGQQTTHKLHFLHVIWALLYEPLSYLGARSAAQGPSSKGEFSHSTAGSQDGAQVVRLAQEALLPAKPSY